MAHSIQGSGRSGDGALRIGTSGYQYDHWRGDFYPEDLPKRGWFAHYAQRFGTVEINNTFYRVPTSEVFGRWRDEAPEGFTFALKFSRFGTHRKKLTDPEQTIPYFLSRAQALQGRMGPILVQLPPGWRANPQRLSDFLALAPRTLRWAVELRDPSWLTEEVYDVLRAHDAALCVHDLLPSHPWIRTASWLYLRFHGVGYGGAYPEEALRPVARRIRAAIHAGDDVYAYFNNDLGGHAPRDAQALLRLCGITGSPRLPLPAPA